MLESLLFERTRRIRLLESLHAFLTRDEERREA
jgi:hypothetical protein